MVGHPDKHGEIVEVHGNGGEPPYLVRFEDGQTRLMFPGPDAVIEHIPHQRSRSSSSSRGSRGSKSKSR